MASRAKRGAAKKFNKTQVKQIRSLYGKPSGKRGKIGAKGRTLADLADRFNASIATIHKIIHGHGAYTTA
jgi:hypothetical protein